MRALFRLTLLIVSTQCFSQGEITKRFFNEKDRDTTEESSLYYAVGRVKDYSLYSDTVTYYYTSNGKVKGRELYSNGVLNGPFSFFHPNGIINKKGFNKNGRPVGYFHIWYPDGKPHQTVYLREKSEGLLPDEQDFVIISYSDSTGKQIVKDKNGWCSCYFPNLITNDPQGDALKYLKFFDLRQDYFLNYSQRSTNYTERKLGKVSNGLPDSTWVIRSATGLVHIEKYEQGVFKSGKTIKGDVEFVYDKIVEGCEPLGGMPGFYSNIFKNLKYPSNARRHGIEGKVFVEFKVGQDGRLYDVHVIKGIGAGCDEEAVRCVKLSPPWVPGKKRGLTVNTKYTLPIIFKLG